MVIVKHTKRNFFAVVNDIPALKEVYSHKEQVRVLREKVDTAVDTVVKDLGTSNNERECVDDGNRKLNLGLRDFEDINNNQCLFESEEDLSMFVNTLNNDQLRIYNTVTSILQHQLDHEFGKCNCNDKKPLLMYISGYGGTGKSYLIKVIKGFLDIQRKSHNGNCDYVVAAPTGLAAAGIGGQTIHSVFNIGIQHGKMSKYISLSANALDQMRAVMANLNCIILDEISMVSNILFLQVHLRLQDALDKTSLFGGKNNILFGDLLQLPPVNSSLPYVEIKGKDISEITDGLKLSVNLWREFAYEELTINQRQSGKGNDIWRKSLGRARLGALNHHDNMILLNRLVSLDYSDANRDKLLDNAVLYFLQLIDKESSSVCLLPTRNMVDEFNRAVMKRLDRKTIEINTLDEIDCKIKSISKNAEEAVKQLDRLDDARHTGGLEKVLVLAIGARVMLRKNLDVTNKLVNGSMGTLVEVVYDKYEVIQLLKIKFDNHDNVINVERDLGKIQIYSNAFLYRKQFPLTIAYAMTIHKSQGLSLKCVLADIGKSVFSPGMSYVCLSRVTSLDGLHLLNFNSTNVKATTSALKEYVRLRSKAFNEKSAKSIHRVKAIERAWYTTGTKRKCINSLSSQTVHSVHNIKRVKVTDSITPAYRDEISLINDLKQYIPQSTLFIGRCFIY